MSFQASRLRRGEVIAGAAAIVLLTLIFVLPWYGVSGAAARSAQQVGLPTSLDGWHALQTVRWLMLVTIAAGLALAILQGTQRAPALPVSFAVIATVLGALTSLALIYRVLISVPQGLDQRAGAYLGLLSAVALTSGAFRSLREEDPPDPARNASIPTVTLPA